MLLDVLLPIGLLIVVAKLMEGALNRFGLSSIIAYTLAGVVLGPATGIVEPTHDLELFLELGIFVLFFIVGLDEIDVPGFVATMRGRYFAAAIISCATTSCPACAAPLRVSSSPCSSPRPDSISTFLHEPAGHNGYGARAGPAGGQVRRRLRRNLRHTDRRTVRARGRAHVQGRRGDRLPARDARERRDREGCLLASGPDDVRIHPLHVGRNQLRRAPGVRRGCWRSRLTARLRCWTGTPAGPGPRPWPP